jgi:hypothetical protein
MTTMIEQANALTTPGDDQPELKALTELCRALAGKLGEVEAIVERLPKTKDGVPAYPGMEVWSNAKEKELGDGPHKCVVQPFWDWDSEEDEWEEHGGVWCTMVEKRWVGNSLSQCFSTREAALSAKGGDDE